MNILIIEDDKLVLNSLKFAIENFGHKASIAENAEAAMEKITDGKFDLIFSDIMMPGISGLSLIVILRTVHLCRIPIIAMSTLGTNSIQEAAIKCGANDFMVKPFTTEDLQTKLEAFEKVKTN